MFFSGIKSIYFAAQSLFLALALIRGSRVSGENEPVSDFSEASCELAVNLLKAQSKLLDGNIVMSPSSIGVLLAILQQGARENTLTQLSGALRMSQEESRNRHKSAIELLRGEKVNVTLEWGNRAYIRPGFELDEKFNQTISENFGAIVEELDFVRPSREESAKKINDWIKEVTKDTIQNLIAPAVLTPETMMILVNAIYFRGLWDVPFEKLLTKDDKFETSPGNSVEVPFMSQKERFTAGEDPESGIQWVDLPFKDEKFSMLFVLPSEKHGLSRVMEKMSGSLLKKIILDQQSRQVTMTIPKFKLTQKTSLFGALKELGVTDIFDAVANFQGITTKHDLRVSKMIHQASVEIDESGSTASAATAFTFEVLSFPKSSDHLLFRADHPFLFFILDKASSLPLFAGRLSDPR